MNKKLLALLIVGVMGAALLTGCGCSNSGDTSSTTTTTANTSTQTQGNASSTVDLNGIKYVDGFYGNDGKGNDFMMAFYEGSAGDIVYVNDGKQEVFAPYTVEKATLADGTEYLVVTIGDLKLGYYEQGENVFFVEGDGNVYAAAHLTEAQIDQLYEIAKNAANK